SPGPRSPSAPPWAAPSPDRSRPPSAGAVLIPGVGPWYQALPRMTSRIQTDAQPPPGTPGSRLAGTPAPDGCPADPHNALSRCPAWPRTLNVTPLGVLRRLAPWMPQVAGLGVGLQTGLLASPPPSPRPASVPATAWPCVWPPGSRTSSTP